ncbi:MAG: hypothetical protein ACP5G4_10885 [bacterium]
MKKAIFIGFLLFASLIKASDIPTSIAEADSIPEGYFTWFVTATGYWPLFYERTPESPYWEALDGITPNRMRINLEKEGFDTTLSDLYHYKTFMDTLYPYDSSIIPDTIALKAMWFRHTFCLKSDSLKLVWDRIDDEIALDFNEEGRLIGRTWTDGYSDNLTKWDNRGNPIYFDYWGGPAGDNGCVETEYDDMNRIRSEKYSYIDGSPQFWFRKFDENNHVIAEIVGNRSVSYFKTINYDNNGNTKTIEIAFVENNEDSKSDTLFTKTTFFDLTMEKMNPDSGFGIDSVKTTGDESVMDKYKRFIEYWPNW